MRYTKRQIQESIAYWDRQLQKNDILNIFSFQLNESVQKDVMTIKNNIKSKINTAEDVKRFIQSNDVQVSNSSNSKIKKIWSILKNIVLKGSAFIYKNWKLTIIIILAVLIYFKGFTWLLDKIIYFIMWICGYGNGHPPEEVQKMLKVSGNSPELEYKDMIDNFNNRLPFDDGTTGTF